MQIQARTVQGNELQKNDEAKQNHAINKNILHVDRKTSNWVSQQVLKHTLSISLINLIFGNCIQRILRVQKVQL